MNPRVLASVGLIGTMVGIGCDKPAETQADAAPQPSAAASSSAPVAKASAAPDDPEAKNVREALWKELRPVSLKKCVLGRMGSSYDGGYVMCMNFVEGVQSVYSYGIFTEDNWGCQISSKYNVPVHQYDCFTPHRPNCGTGNFDFHSECVGDKAETREGKPFDTIAHQIEKNGDAKKKIILKIDVEGAEWDSLLATPDAVLDKFDQMPMELHAVEGKFAPRVVDLMKKLKNTFYLVDVHYNNHACAANAAPLPAWAVQLSWVNKRLDTVDASKPVRGPGTPPDAKDNPDLPDCQPTAWPE